jgi:hypothetical protein
MTQNAKIDEFTGEIVMTDQFNTDTDYKFRIFTVPLGDKKQR